jgi:metal-sulfur cluster biosynthetic enzyme
VNPSDPFDPWFIPLCRSAPLMVLLRKKFLSKPGEHAMVTEEMVRTALKNVVDPEIGLDVINLGLVYNVDIQDQGKKVQVDMTLTTPACPAGPQILEQARREIIALQDVFKDLEDVSINLVWTPFWNPSMMTEEAREELGFF